MVSQQTEATNMAPGEVLTRLAAAVQRLGPDHRHPELFHILKSEIAAELRRLAKQIDEGDV